MIENKLLEKRAAEYGYDLTIDWREYPTALPMVCLLYTSDAADERSSVDLGGRRIITKKNTNAYSARPLPHTSAPHMH